MPFLRLDHLSKSFAPRVQAVRAVSLSAAANECHVLFGPSGCGKTTTLRLVAGLEQPSAGDIFNDERRANDAPPWQRGVVMVFQRPVLMPGKRVGRLLEDFGEDRSGVTSAPPGGRRLIELELDQLLARYPHQLSGGEKQRVALARALLQTARYRGHAWPRSPLLLLDEPLAHLDLPIRRRLWRQLVLLRKRFPATMLYVTHDPAEALALGDRISVLLAGEMVQTGTPDEIRARPEHRFVAEAFQDPDDPLNLIDGVSAGGFFHGPFGKWKLSAASPGGSVTLGVAASQLRVVRDKLARDSVAAEDPAAGDFVSWSPEPCAIEWIQRGFRLVLLSCTRGPARIQVQAEPSDGFQPGQTAMIELAGNKVHWFDRVSGRLKSPC
jgi:multiple sugar transport system ATP-binding protein